MSVDNPYYFFNQKSSKTPEPVSLRLAFFKRRSSKSDNEANHSKNMTIPRNRSLSSATLGLDVSVLDSPRESFTSTISLEEKNTKTPDNNIDFISFQRHTHKKPRQRLGSYNESMSYCEIDEAFSYSPRNTLSKTLPEKLGFFDDTRRQSFGNLKAKERNKVKSTLDEVPKMIAPKPPIFLFDKQHYEHKKENYQTLNMDDILIITAKYSERAILWASFLKNRFDKITKQRGRKSFNFLHVKIDDRPLPPEIIRKCQNATLQMAILCPVFIALPHSYLRTQLLSFINSEKVLCILLEVPEDKVLEIHKTAFPGYNKWRRCAVRDNDQSMISNVVGIATDILGRALCQRPPCHETNESNMKANGTESFTVVPRKVKIGHNKIFLLLNDALSKDDWIDITIENAGKFIDVTNFKKRNPYTLQFSIPETCMEVSTMIEIHIRKNKKDIGSRLVKCESRLRDLEQLLRSQKLPFEFMCHSFGIEPSERDALDIHLFQCFQRNIPPNFHLLAGPFEKQDNRPSVKGSTSLEEFPTLLHFAAKWGLERLSLQLLECPGGDAACEITNKSGMTPHEIAVNEGFFKLGSNLKSFAQMHEFTTMYHYFKGLSNTTSNKYLTESSKKNIEVSNVLENPAKKYMQIPSPLAVTNLNYINIDTKKKINSQISTELSKRMNEIKLVDKTEVKSTEIQISDSSYFHLNEKNKTDKFSQECFNTLENYSSLSSKSGQSDYLIQPTNIPISSKNQNYFMTDPSNLPRKSLLGNYTNNKGTYLSCTDEENDLKKKYKKKTLQQQSSIEHLKHNGIDSSKNNVEDELVEIMCDFKNNVLTIKEVEQLVEKWKNRNDVKQSFKDKQEQIEKMREEYERIQEQVKKSTKSPNPFECVKKFFLKNRKTQIKQSSSDVDSTKTAVPHINVRPISSLSSQSASSSSSLGHMSTSSEGSRASLVDSGTHSDNEDRCQIPISSSYRFGRPGSLVANYCFPPTPKSVSPKSLMLEMSEDKVSHEFQNIRTPVSDHYIFIPSNVPVQNSLAEVHNSNSGLNTIHEAKEISSEVGQSVKSFVQKNEMTYSTSPCKQNPCSSRKPILELKTGKTIPLDNKDLKKFYQNIDSFKLNKYDSFLEKSCGYNQYMNI